MWPRNVFNLAKAEDNSRHLACAANVLPYHEGEAYQKQSSVKERVYCVEPTRVVGSRSLQSSKLNGKPVSGPLTRDITAFEEELTKEARRSSKKRNALIAA